MKKRCLALRKSFQAATLLDNNIFQSCLISWFVLLKMVSTFRLHKILYMTRVCFDFIVLIALFVVLFLFPANQKSANKIML